MHDEGSFTLEQSDDDDGWLRLSLIGELDLLSSETLNQRLAELKEAGRPARVDLSRLEFIDSSGVRILVLSVRDGRREGWAVEVERQLSWQVQQVFELLGLGQVLWPDADA